jgi:hypothetical protein
MCGGGNGDIDCTAACSADADCLPNLPFCVSLMVRRDTGDVFNICPPGGPPFCAAISAC